MKLASVKDVKNKLSDYLKKAEREDIIITRNGRPQRSSTIWERTISKTISSNTTPRFARSLRSAGGRIVRVEDVRWSRYASGSLNEF
jgi:hypothetical protein